MTGQSTKIDKYSINFEEAIILFVSISASSIAVTFEYEDAKKKFFEKLIDLGSILFLIISYSLLMFAALDSE